MFYFTENKGQPRFDVYEKNLFPHSHSGSVFVSHYPTEKQLYL